MREPLGRADFISAGPRAASVSQYAQPSSNVNAVPFCSRGTETHQVLGSV